jgi:hypothetical protein
VVIAPTPPQTPHEKRAEGLSGWAQLGAAILFQVPALRPDAAVVAHYGPAFAEEAANLADEDERAAALLDKISGMGPYAALVSILAQAGMQVAVNHGFMRPGFMGTLPPEEFVTVVTIDKFVGESDDKPPTARSTTT